MSELNLKNTIEAVLLVAGEPLSVERIQMVFDEYQRPNLSQINSTLEALMQDYQSRGIELKKLASGYCFQARQEHAQEVSRLFEEKPPKYSRALLETLAIIAYRQPITRAEIEEIRGVAVSSTIIKTLVDREWIRVVAHRDVPGKPGIYATTKNFLDYFNLAHLDQLPSLKQVREEYAHVDDDELSLPLLLEFVE